MVEVIINSFPVVFMIMLEKVILAVLEGYYQLLDLSHQSINILTVASDSFEVRP